MKVRLLSSKRDFFVASDVLVTDKHRNSKVVSKIVPTDLQRKSD